MDGEPEPLSAAKSGRPKRFCVLRAFQFCRRGRTGRQFLAQVHLGRLAKQFSEEKRAHFSGWLSLTGNPYPKKKKEGHHWATKNLRQSAALRQALLQLRQQALGGLLLRLLPANAQWIDPAPRPDGRTERFRGRPEENKAGSRELQGSLVDAAKGNIMQPRKTQSHCYLSAPIICSLPGPAQNMLSREKKSTQMAHLPSRGCRPLAKNRPIRLKINQPRSPALKKLCPQQL